MKAIIHGVETHYQVMGKGTPLVLLHGWGCDWQIWYPVIQALSDHFQLILPDLPAFGRSSNPPETWVTQDYATWLNDFLLHTVQNKQCFLAGHSFGGKVSAVFASKNPAVLKKLILVDASGLPDDLPQHKKIQESVLSLVPQFIKDLLPSSWKEKALQMTRSSTDHYNSTQTQRAVLRNTIKEYIINEAKLISVPTLLIWGKNDPDTPPHQGEIFQKSINGSELVVFNKSGHFPFLDEPEKFITEIKEFCIP